MMTVELKMYRTKAQQLPVKTLREASKAVRAYISENELGGSTWEGGAVRVNGKFTYEVSYNGRVWAQTSYTGWTPETVEILNRELDIER